MFGVLINDICNRFALAQRYWVWKIKFDWLSETTNYYSFSFLRHTIIKRIQYLVMNIIPSPLKMRKYYFKSPTAIMRCKITHIFKHKCLWLLRKKYLLYAKKKCSLRLMLESFLVTNNREWLTRESC